MLAVRRASLLAVQPSARRALPHLARARFFATASAPPTLDTPFISDTIPLAEGNLGTVMEMLCEPGQEVDENEVMCVAGE